jgi:hypothetical protein
VPNPFQTAALNVIESAPVQAELLAAITAGEAGLETYIDAAISGAKGVGAFGLLIAAAKGSFETAINAEFANLPPAEIATWITETAKKELGG